MFDIFIFILFFVHLFKINIKHEHYLKWTSLLGGGNPWFGRRGHHLNQIIEEIFMVLILIKNIF